jgi:acyl dehydratase
MTDLGQPTLPSVGSQIPAWEVDAVSAEKMKTMAALLDDSNPIHFDTEALRELGMGERPINQGPINIAYVHNMLMNWAGASSVRRLKVRFLANVHAGDRLVADGTVTAVTEDGDQAFVECDVALRIDGGETALTGTATVVWRASTGEKS